MRKDAETWGAKRSRSRGKEGQKRKKTRGHGDARTRGAAGHTDLRTEISRGVSPEGTLRTWAPGHLCTEHLLTPHFPLSASSLLCVSASGAKGLMPRQAA
ncbi:MAG: hypothetical protein BRC53_14280 [Cyanobacteria bacterium SW_6_48_11]|nr:MAG: hypothetical protein BRC53_14280 [Cyanobacteria bacterium SW_6_48_11]